jgi:O-acetyl-ADP-ribose deacetylase (regulator of RNase III)
LNQSHIPARIIVNPAYSQLKETTGICQAIFDACGNEKKKLIDSCQRKLDLNDGHISEGQVVMTPTFGPLGNNDITQRNKLYCYFILFYMYTLEIIHAVAPTLLPGSNLTIDQEKALRMAYRNSLKEAYNYFDDSEDKKNRTIVS